MTFVDVCLAPQSSVSRTTSTSRARFIIIACASILTSHSVTVIHPRLANGAIVTRGTLTAVPCSRRMASSTVKTWSRFAKVDFCLASVAREAARTPAGVALLHVHAIAAILTWATPAWLNASLAMHAGKVLSVCKKKKKQKKFV